MKKIAKLTAAANRIETIEEAADDYAAFCCSGVNACKAKRKSALVS